MERYAAAAAEPGWVRLTGGAVWLMDGVCRVTGYVVALAALGTVLVCFATVYLRYAVGTGMIWLQEVYVWTHVVVIVLGAGYTMMSGGFVRVDVFYSTWNDRRRALADMVMTVVVLLPFLWVFGSMSWIFFIASLRADEGSLNPDGLRDLWLLKGTLVGFIVLIGLQGVAFVLRGVLVLSGYPQYALQHAGHSAEDSL